VEAGTGQPDGQSGAVPRVTKMAIRNHAKIFAVASRDSLA